MTDHTGLTRDDVEAAASRVVTAFSQTDTEAYFAAFSEDATFIFHTEAERLSCRKNYEELWDSWLAEGWRVTSCVSSNPSIQLLGESAVFSHDVTTTINTGETTYERETIIFHRNATGTVQAVHEHLSPLPTVDPSDSPEIR